MPHSAIFIQARSNLPNSFFALILQVSGEIPSLLVASISGVNLLNFFTADLNSRKILLSRPLLNAKLLLNNVTDNLAVKAGCFVGFDEIVGKTVLLIPG